VCRTSRTVVFAALLFAGAVLGGGSAVAHPAGPALEGPGGIAAGPDGNMWFTEFGHCNGWCPTGGARIGRITPAGLITEFSKGISPRGGPSDIAEGSDGNMWFTERFGGRIGRITPTGVVAEFSKGISVDAVLGDIAPGPDGNLWFTEDLEGSRIGRITPTGLITEFSKGITPHSDPSGIAAGPDGNMWFIGQSKIGRITPGGAITEFAKGGGIGIAAGPDGNMWFTGDGIGRIGVSGMTTRFSKGMSPNSSHGPTGIATGPDGNMWFTDAPWSEDAGPNDARIGRITPDGIITEYSNGIIGDSAPEGIAAGPDGNMWFTESNGNRIGRITMNGVISEFPATAQILRVRQVGMRVAVRLRCPAGAALPCKGTVRLGKTGNGGARRLDPLAAGQSTTVVVPISSKWRRLLVAGRRLNVTLLLMPEAHSMAGALSQPITLRARIRPRIAVTG
jgi:streptogramin lyase